ncbi:MAG TPA: hypothetical protein VF009_00030 [Solirubrobacterales bacterium]
MSEASTDIDVKELLQGLEERARETQQRAKELREAPTPKPGESEQLIKSVAENLAAIREEAGLPTKSVSHYEEQIRLKQKLARK